MVNPIDGWKKKVFNTHSEADIVFKNKKKLTYLRKHVFTKKNMDNMHDIIEEWDYCWLEKLTTILPHKNQVYLQRNKNTFWARKELKTEEHPDASQNLLVFIYKKVNSFGMVVLEYLIV